MHTAISCATCARPLRIPTELVGQSVRCPFCTDAFIAVANPALKFEAEKLNQQVAHTEAPSRAEAGVLALAESEPEQPVVEESFTVDLESPVKVAPPKPWMMWIFVNSDSDRRLWGEMKAEVSADGLRIFRGHKEVTVPVGCEATRIRGGQVRVVVGSRTVEFQIKRKHIYKARLAGDIAGFLNGERPMPLDKGYGWPWYQWLLLLAPLSLIAVLFAGELPDTDLKPLKGFAIFMLAILAPPLMYALWNMERLSVALRWTMACLLVAGVCLLTGSMYWFGPRLPPAMTYADWHTFSPPDAPYTISMPGPTIVEDQRAAGLDFIKHSARVKPNQLFVVAYTELQDGQWLLNRAHPLDYGKAYVTSVYPNAYRSGNERLLNDDLSGMEQTYYTGSGHHDSLMVVRMYVVDKRLYILIASEVETSHRSTFFNSFKVAAALPVLPSPRTWPGLAAYWSFDDGAGQWVQEELGRDVSPLNSCQWTTGRRRTGLKLPGGLNSYIQYRDTLPLNFKDRASFTFAGWFKTNRVAEAVLVSQRNITDPSTIIHIGINRTGHLSTEVHPDGLQADTIKLNSNTVVVDGEWHHFALMRDAKSMSLYVDGQEEQSQIEVTGMGPITTDLRAFGCDLFEQQLGVLNGNDFQGSLDEMCIFHRKLTDDEIKQLAGKKR
jgi:hypothetical protein